MRENVVRCLLVTCKCSDETDVNVEAYPGEFTVRHLPIG